MDLRRLRHFVAVAEEGHITRAAERLGMQQPPLSQSIQGLEEELGARLFRRLPRGVALTEPGRALLIEARAIFERLDHARLVVERTARGEQGRVAVGLTSSAPFHPFTPRIIRSFAEANPLVSLSLEEAHTTELLDGLRSERLDIVFVRTPVADVEGLDVFRLLKEDMVAALPQNHALAKTHTPIRFARLAREKFIVYRRPSGPGLYDAIFAACHRAGFSPTIVQEAPRIGATLNLVAAGLGISIVPQSLQRMRLDGVAWRALSDTRGLHAPIIGVARRGEGSQAVKRFVALARKAAREGQG